MQEKRAGNWQTTAATAIMVVAALALVVSFFLPYASATEEYREAVSAAPDFVVSEEAGVTAGDLVDVSLFEYARLYASAPEFGESGVYAVYVPLFVSEGVLSLLALLFAALRKPIPTMVATLLAAGILALLNWDFSDRGVITGEQYAQGVAHWTYLAAVVLSLASAVWLLTLKVRAKRARRRGGAPDAERPAAR